MIFAAPLVFVSLLLGFWLKRWWAVLALFAVGTAVAGVGWSADWFGDQDTPALGGALLFELFICMPVVVGAGVGVGLRRWGGSGLSGGASSR